jgi:hypothetical protein
VPQPPPTQRLPVAFDTNVVEAEGWGLSSERMRMLAHEAQSVAIALVPEVVRLELAHHGTEAAAKAAKQYRDVVGKLKQLAVGTSFCADRRSGNACGPLGRDHADGAGHPKHRRHAHERVVRVRDRMHGRRELGLRPDGGRGLGRHSLASRVRPEWRRGRVG